MQFGTIASQQILSSVTLIMCRFVNIVSEKCSLPWADSDITEWVRQEPHFNRNDRPGYCGGELKRYL